MADWGDFHLVSGAGWSVYWRISQAAGSGLELWFADFLGKRVLWRGTQPFAIVPYHNPLSASAYPLPPEFTFKDGLNPTCDGAYFTALKHGVNENPVDEPRGGVETLDTERAFWNTRAP